MANPIRAWSWPGTTADVTMIERVRADLRDWQLSRMVWVTDRGFAFEHNRRVLRTGGGHIQAEKLRHPTAEAAALAAPGDTAAWPATCASRTSPRGPTTR